MVDIHSVTSSLLADGESYRKFQSNMYQSNDGYPEYELESGNKQNGKVDSFEDLFQDTHTAGGKVPVIHSDWKAEEDTANNDWNIFRHKNTQASAGQSAVLSDDTDDELESDRTFPDKRLNPALNRSVPNGSYHRDLQDSITQSYTLDNEEDVARSSAMKAKGSVDDWMRQEKADEDNSEDDIETDVLSTGRTFDSDVTLSHNKTDQHKRSSEQKIPTPLNEKGRTTFDVWQTKNKGFLSSNQDVTTMGEGTESHNLHPENLMSGETWRSHITDATRIEKELDEIQLTPHSVEQDREDLSGTNGHREESEVSLETFVGNTGQPGSEQDKNKGQGSQSRSSFEAWKENREVANPGLGVVMETGRTDSSLNTDVLMHGYKENAAIDGMDEDEPTRNYNLVGNKNVTQTYSKPQKSQSLYDSDVSRKYQSYMTHHESKNELKREFVKEMLTRAKDRQGHKEDLCGNTWKRADADLTAARTSSESAKHYPRGVTLSKTFTKTSNFTPAGRKWDSRKYEELAYGPSNIFLKDQSKKSSHLGAYGTSKKYLLSDFTTKNWKIHGNKDLVEKDRQKSGIEVVSDLGEEGPNENGAPVDVSVIDESYYKGLLVSSPIPRFSDSDSDVISPIQSPEIVAATASTNQKSLTRKNDFKSSTYTRPHSANNVQSRKNSNFQSKGSGTKATSAKNIHQPDSMGLSVEGVKQDTGPKRPNSAIGRYRTNHNPSFVDETLFGSKQQEPSFDAPWGEPDKVGKKPLPYVAITSMEPHLDRKTVPAKNVSRQGSAKSRPVSASTKKKQTKELHNFQQAYVDETLFSGGGKTGYAHSAPGFKAPWNKEREPKPHAFDATDYRAVNARKKSQKMNENKKPVWK